MDNRDKRRVEMSLDEQVKNGRRYCDERGYHLVKVYKDLGPVWGKPSTEGII